MTPRQQQIAAAPILQSAQEKVALLSGIAETVEGDEREEGREWLAREPLSAPRSFVNGFAIAVLFWLAVAGAALALGARPW